MKIGILSRNPRCYSTKRLREEAASKGHQVKVLDTLKFSLNVEEAAPRLFHQNKRLSAYDAVIPRIGASITFYGLAVVRQFEQMGVFTLNSAQSIARSRDKLHSMQIFSRHDIGIPHTAFVHQKEDVLPALERLGGAPVIIKLLKGTQGVGVILAETVRVAQAIVETMQSTRQDVLLQKFIKESEGKDIRALVVGDRVVAAMRRQAAGDEFRSNVHRGGSATAVQLNPQYERTAVRAAQILGLRVAGVDMLEGAEGPQIMEVNSSPGLEGIEKASGENVAKEIISEVEKNVLFPEMDLRQRLTLSAGYGIAEVLVHNLPDIENKMLRETDLNDRNILVISITRQLSQIPIPKGDTRILSGDKLVCFGELRELRNLLPEKLRKKKKKMKETFPVAS